MILAVSEVTEAQEAAEEELEDELTYFPMMAGLSLIDNAAQYKYIQMGPQSFMTVVIPKNKRPNRSKSRGLSRHDTYQGNNTCGTGGPFGCLD